jgi:hypothetical protein
MSRRKHCVGGGSSSDGVELFFVCAKFTDDGKLKVMSALHPLLESELTGGEMTALTVSVKSVVSLLARVFAHLTDRECGTSFSESEGVFSMFDRI